MGRRSKGEGEGGTNWEIRNDTHTLPCIKQRASGKLVLCDDLDGWDGGAGREVQEGGDIGVHVADSLCCTAETNTTL